MTGLFKRPLAGVGVAVAAAALASCSTHGTSSAGNRAAAQLRSDVAAASTQTAGQVPAPSVAGKSPVQAGAAGQATGSTSSTGSTGSTAARSSTTGKQRKAARGGNSQQLDGPQLPSRPAPPTDRPEPPTGQKAPTVLLRQGAGSPGK
jgi:hypothetical protein